MSLLLDALKRAEQEKLARQSGAAVPATSASAPRPAASPPPAHPAGSLELQPLGQGGEAPAHRSAATAKADAGVAQNVFQAKSPPPAAAGAGLGPRNRTVLWATLGAIALVAIAAGSYVWYSVNALTPQHAASRPRAAPTLPPASSAPLPPPAAMGTIVPAPGAPPAPVEVTATVAPAQGAAPPSASLAAVAPESTAERLAREGAASAAIAPAPLRMDRAAESPRRVPAEVSAGYEALRQGDLAAARRSYAAALASDPGSVDAHLGLATIAARGLNRAVAADHYRRALVGDPSNATAIAGLAALADYSRPEALEAQLRADIARLPESAALHFTLGNLYSTQGHWNEAQAAYFEAHRLEPGSADIAFNLAVSLDQLGQRKVAADFYRRALESAAMRSGQFDPAAAARRLAELR